jgi:hypothetical protein
MVTNPLPLDFAAKVRLRMAFDRNPVFPMLQDKLASKHYARHRGVGSARVFWEGTNPEAIPFDELPSRCFLKANHGCGWNILIFNGQAYNFGNGQHLCDSTGRLLDADQLESYALSREATLAYCRRMLSTVYSRKEWAYTLIPPRLFVEEALEPAAGQSLIDYRLYTFRGRVRAISLGSADYRKLGRNLFLTPQWEEIPLTVYRELPPANCPSKPEELADMLAAAERLGRDIDFVRIDLYGTTLGIRLGELTLYPHGGNPDTPTKCPQFNRWLGQEWWPPSGSSTSPQVSPRPAEPAMPSRPSGNLSY